MASVWPISLAGNYLEQGMTVTVTNMHHVYMRKPSSRQAWRRGVLIVIGGVLVAAVLFWVTESMLK